MKFSTRDLLLVALVLILSLGWAIDQWRNVLCISGPTEFPKVEITPGKYVGEIPNSFMPTPIPPKPLPMKYSLRSLMIMSIVAPPLLAGLWSFGASAIARMRLHHHDQWEDVGGPGSIAEFSFSTEIWCYIGTDENEENPALPNSEAPEELPPKN
jgi:hypothetical protein